MDENVWASLPLSFFPLYVLLSWLLALSKRIGLQDWLRQIGRYYSSEFPAVAVDALCNLAPFICFLKQGVKLLSDA